MYGCSYRYVSGKKDSLTDKKLVTSKIRLLQRLFLVFFHDKEWCCRLIYLTTCVHPYASVLVLIYFIHLVCNKINSFITSLISNAKEKKWMQVSYNSTIAILGFREGIAHMKNMPLNICMHDHLTGPWFSYIIWMTAPITFFEHNKHGYKLIVLAKLR